MSSSLLNQKNHSAAAVTTAATSSADLPPLKTLKGFALYVGLSDETLLSQDPQLKTIVEQLQQRVAELDPGAKTYTAIALASPETRGDSLDIVRVALGEPRAKNQVAKPDRGKGLRPTGVTIDFSRGLVFLDGIDAELTYKEFQLLRFLVLREGLTVTRADIASLLWPGGDELANGSRAIDVHVRRLRSKLCDYHKIINTIRGAGYRFDRHADVTIVHPTGPSPDAF